MRITLLRVHSLRGKKYCAAFEPGTVVVLEGNARLLRSANSDAQKRYGGKNEATRPRSPAWLRAPVPPGSVDVEAERVREPGSEAVAPGSTDRKYRVIPSLRKVAQHADLGGGGAETTQYLAHGISLQEGIQAPLTKLFWSQHTSKGRNVPPLRRKQHAQRARAGSKHSSKLCDIPVYLQPQKQTPTLEQKKREGNSRTRHRTLNPTEVTTERAR